MQVIHKISNKIRAKGSNYPLVQYALLTQEQSTEISGTQKTGETFVNELNETVEKKYPVSLIKSIEFVENENAFLDDVTNIIFYEGAEKDAVLLAHQNKLVDNSFKKKKYKIHILNLTDVLNAGFEKYWIKFNSNNNIVVEKLAEVIENDLTIMPYNVYFNIIAPSDEDAFNNAIAAGLITKEENPTKEI